VTAEDDERVGELLAYASRQPECAESLGGEVALQADDVRREGAQSGEAFGHPVDADVDDLAGVAVDFQTAGHALEAERLDEGDHLEANDSADGWLQKRDFHAISPGAP